MLVASLAFSLKVIPVEDTGCDHVLEECGIAPVVVSEPSRRTVTAWGPWWSMP